jgi:hypothetical protein
MTSQSRVSLEPVGLVPALLLSAVLLLTFPVLLHGQDTAGGGGAGAQVAGSVADTVQLVFEREIFSYPAFQRRNPFRPLTGPGDAGPRFEDLILLGAIVSSNPSQSVALLGTRGAGAGAGEVTHRLRAGQMIGNTRIVEVRPREVVVDVQEFGLQERRVLQLVRTAPEAQGGTEDVSTPVQGDTTTASPDSVVTDGGTQGGGSDTGSAGAPSDGHVGSNGNGGT